MWGDAIHILLAMLVLGVPIFLAWLFVGRAGRDDPQARTRKPARRRSR